MFACGSGFSPCTSHPVPLYRPTRFALLLMSPLRWIATGLLQAHVSVRCGSGHPLSSSIPLSPANLRGFIWWISACGLLLRLSMNRLTRSILTDQKSVSTTLFALESSTYSQHTRGCHQLQPRHVCSQPLKIKDKRPAMSHAKNGAIFIQAQVTFIFVACAAATDCLAPASTSADWDDMILGCVIRLLGFAAACHRNATITARCALKATHLVSHDRSPTK